MSICGERDGTNERSVSNISHSCLNFDWLADSKFSFQWPDQNRKSIDRFAPGTQVKRFAGFRILLAAGGANLIVVSGTDVFITDDVDEAGRSSGALIIDAFNYVRCG